MATRTLFVLLCVALLLLALASPAHGFGAGNIASIAKIEGINYRHGDITDTLKELVFLNGRKWSTGNVRRVYFGNWLRDYSQALDVGTLKSVNKDTIRLLVWILSFLGFGYATGEFEVTEERLGTYRPEEHIDNPKDYADNADARQYDPRLRPPVQQVELAIDPLTGMKNYIANESGGWATSSGYIKHSLTRSIHYGRLWTSGGGTKVDKYEALRCLGQASHCMEDFSAHSNYVELVLRELGFTGVFPHTGIHTEMEIGVHPGQRGGRRAFPIVTGTFGSVDFLHSVLGEVQDKFSQTDVDEISELDQVLAGAHDEQKREERQGQKSVLKGLLKQVPNCGDLANDADKLEEEADAQEMANMRISNQRSQPQQIGGYNVNALDTIQKIYPILQFRDKVVRTIEITIEKIPGLSALVEKITDTLTLFVLSLLAPFIRPIIAQASLELKAGSSAVVDSSANKQFEPWNDPYCTDPTHSLLSKDHFSNKLNTPAGEVATSVLRYVVPRVVYAWENPNIPVQQVLDDVVRVFHHPALRDPNSQLHSDMFNAVAQWIQKLPDHGQSLNVQLGSEGVRTGKNHTGAGAGHSHGLGHSKTTGGEWQRGKKKAKKGGSGGGDKYSSIPGVSETGSGGVSVGGMKLPGALGGMVGGILDAGMSGYKERKSGERSRPQSSYGQYEEHKEKDKKEKHGHSRDPSREYREYGRERSRSREKHKDKPHKERYEDQEYKPHKEHKDKKDKRDKKDKKKKHDKYDSGESSDGESYSTGSGYPQRHYNAPSAEYGGNDHRLSSEYGGYPHHQPPHEHGGGHHHQPEYSGGHSHQHQPPYPISNETPSADYGAYHPQHHHSGSTGYGGAGGYHEQPPPPQYHPQPPSHDHQGSSGGYYEQPAPQNYGYEGGRGGYYEQPPPPPGQYQEYPPAPPGGYGY